MHYWSQEEKAWLAEHYKHYTRAQLVPLFNERFNVDVTKTQLIGVLKNNKIQSGRDGKFTKGQTSWNKGKLGIHLCGERGKETQFKMGHTPVNYRPVGSERIRVDGYIEVKVADPSEWRTKHVVVWEEAHGPIPKDHCLIFLDENKQNVALENLQVITRAQLARINQHQLRSTIPEVTQTGIILAEVYTKIGARKNALKKEKRERRKKK